MPMNKSKPEMEMPKPQQFVEERMPGGKYSTMTARLGG